MKKLLTIVSGIALASAVHADLLYWQVGEDYANATTWDYAVIYSSTDAGTTMTKVAQNYLDADGTLSSATPDRVTAQEFAVATAAYANIGTYSSSSINAFAIELWNTASNQAIANSGWITDNIADYVVYTDTISHSVGQMTASAGLGAAAGTWNAGAVPEPTSGLMMLLGMAMLGLRRRKVA